MYRKGISPVIATVIIVAVAVAISIAVVGWIMGLWGSIAGGTESLKIYPDSYINKSEETINLHIANVGSAAAVIYKVEVVGVTTCTNDNGITMGPGNETTLTINVTSTEWSCSPSSVSSATAGAYYLVKVYTKAGNVYQANVICKS